MGIARIFRSWPGLRVFAGVAGFALASVSAAAHKPNVDRRPDPAENVPVPVLAIEQLSLSDALADFGERQADPVALIEAAKIRKMLPSTLAGPENADPTTRSWKSLLARAAQFSGDNPALAGLIADVRAYQRREIPSLADNVHLLHRLVKQKSADRAEVRFKTGEFAIVYIRSDAPANLGLFVYDEFNNLICSGDTATSEALCRWRPRWDGVYLLDVRNETTDDIQYQLAINHEIVAH